MSCCEKWEKASSSILSASAASIGAQAEPAQIEFDEGWQVPGCCGGGCYVLTDLIFCPWCSEKLSEPVKERVRG